MMRSLMLLLLISAGVCAAQTPSDAGLTKAEEWIGRALILRGFPEGYDLRYDVDGHLQGETKPVDWTLSGFDLEKITRRADTALELSGIRVAIRYNADQHIFERHLLKDERMKLVLPAEKPEQVQHALANVFSIGIDPALQRSMPSYWSHYFIPSLPWPDDPLNGQNIVTGNGKQEPDLVYPVPYKKPEPGISPEALKDKVHGTVVLRTDVDIAGTPRCIVIRQPLGYGLDARTVETVAKYRFRPGILDGKPVAVEVVIDQQFQ